MRRHFWTTNFGLSQESSISYLVFTQEIFWKKKDLPHLVPIDLKRMFLDRISFWSISLCACIYHNVVL